MKIIEERLETFTKEEMINSTDRKSTRRLVFLDSLLTQMHNEKLSLDDIQEEVDTFIFEGHDTTAAAINYFCYLVGCHPDVQAKIHVEMDSIFGGIRATLSLMLSILFLIDDRERTCTMEDIQQMTYLDCVIKVENNFLFHHTRNRIVFFCEGIFARAPISSICRSKRSRRFHVS